MPSNFKKLVRKRMAETGESWQTASRKVRAQAQVSRADADSHALTFDPRSGAFSDECPLCEHGLDCYEHQEGGGRG